MTAAPESFEAYLATRGLTDVTYANYVRVGKRIAASGLTPQEWLLAQARREPRPKLGTVKSYEVVAKTYWFWLRRVGHRTPGIPPKFNPARHWRKAHAADAFEGYSPTQRAELIERVKAMRMHDSARGAIILVALTGLHLTEVCALRFDQLERRGRYFGAWTGRAGCQPTFTPFTSAAREFLFDATFTRPKTGPVFPAARDFTKSIGVHFVEGELRRLRTELPPWAANLTSRTLRKGAPKVAPPKV